jgi:hypothetical protein
MKTLHFLNLSPLPKRLFWLLGFCLAITVLSGCTPPTFPLEITAITVDPEPLIGETVTVRFEFMSTEDEPDTTLEVVLQDGIKLVNGSLLWQGSLTANQKESHEISICTQFEGTWRIEGFVWSKQANGGSYQDAEMVVLEVSENAARVIPSSQYEYRVKGEPGEGLTINTPLPELLTPICP